MDTIQDSQNNKVLLKLLLADSLKFQEEIKKYTQEIADLKKQILKINMENGSLIMQNKKLVSGHKIKIDEIMYENDTLKESDQTKKDIIAQLEEENAQLKKKNMKINIENGSLFLQKNKFLKEIEELKLQYAQKIIDIEQKNSMLSNTCKTMLRQQTELNDKKKSLLDQIKKLEEDLVETQTREANYIYTTALQFNKVFDEIAQLKKFNQTLLEELSNK